MSFHTDFGDAWPRWLGWRFGDCPRAIADNLGCTRRQALNYLNGDSLPSGRLLARCLRRWPEDTDRILGGGAACATRRDG